MDDNNQGYDQSPNQNPNQYGQPYPNPNQYGQQGQYGQPYPYRQMPPGGYPPPPPPKPPSGGVGALVFGILSLVFFWTPYLPLVTGVLGLALSITARMRGVVGIANGAMVLSILGLIFGGLVNAACYLCNSSMGGFPGLLV